MAFKNFLLQKFDAKYHGHGADAFAVWLETLSTEEFIQYGDEYGQRCQNA